MIETRNLGQLAGKHVVGPDGEKIGKIDDVYESTDDNRGTFATVTTGLFGGGASFFPLDAAELRGDDVVVPYSKDFIKDAPRVENDEELTGPEEQRLFEYYAQSATTGATGTTTTGTQARRTVGHDTSGPATDDAMTRSEEQLRVGTERVESGRARLRKYVTTETEARTVPVSREEVRVEREPITDGNIGEAMDGPAISEEEHEVVLTEEHPVVQKDVVPVERVRLDKDTVTDQQQVTEDVRTEHIDTEGAAGADVYAERTQARADTEPRR
jgi:uncharacterized protein (TIGR02271 family)